MTGNQSDTSDVADLEWKSAVRRYRFLVVAALGLLVLVLPTRLPQLDLERCFTLVAVLVVPPWLSFRRGESWGAAVVVLVTVAVTVDWVPNGRPVPHLKGDGVSDWLLAGTLLIFLSSYYRLIALEFNPLSVLRRSNNSSRIKPFFLSLFGTIRHREPNPRPVEASEVVIAGLVALAAPLVWWIVSTIFTASLGSAIFFGLPSDLAVGLLAALLVGLGFYFFHGLWWEWRRRSATSDLARFELQMLTHRELRSDLAILERGRLRGTRPPGRPEGTVPG